MPLPPFHVRTSHVITHVPGTIPMTSNVQRVPIVRRAGAAASASVANREFFIRETDRRRQACRYDEAEGFLR
ncbi:hypothetical protein KDW_22400 [Dictyobacter vulcani]|uniref:Uncharacterized protein n=1 Tax=Dictyobacter vulcani TaxID=2607529 RepID=A0A5J4KF99_9CHLR|nr:hypothetical protein KDW_22400 [Dictyobacter vulcani]